MEHSFRFCLAAAGLTATLAICAWLPIAALAGTTGTLSGAVVDSKSRQPIAGVRVTALSPSQRATTTTDASGRFTFISLQPDTYSLSTEKSGYEPQSIAGIAIFADQSQTISISLLQSLKEIAHVTSRSSLSPVRAGTGTDVYSVNPAVTEAAAPLGGGGGLNNAYSAIAAMPGAYVPPNQVGVNQTVYIRGGYYDQIGYEYDGVPINRSFDNYPANSETTLGQQELEIYTGGGGADANATGLSGFVNQVIKTGTYPGYGSLGGALGTPTFYHDLRIEAGGSTPDRRFSYYAGISGTNQDFRYFDQYNGADLISDVPYGYWPAHVTTLLPFYPAVYPTCNSDTTYDNPAVDAGILTNDPGCFGSYAPNYGQPATFDSRDVVANFHFAIPHRHDSGSDDIQALFMTSTNFTQYYTSTDDAGALANGINTDGNLASTPDVYSGNTNQWPDYYTFPAGTPWLASAATPPVAYMYPGSPTDRCANVVGVPNSCPIDANGNQETVQIPNNYRDGRWDQASIVKLQYQKNMGSNAYVRLFGYTFYSNSNEASANGYGNNVSLGVLNYDYEVDSHTRGVEMQFADQVSGKNLISGMASFLMSGTLRYYNHNYFNTSSQQVSNFTNGSQCFATSSGAGVDPASNYQVGYPAPCNDPITQGSFGAPFGAFAAQNPCTSGQVPANSPACTSGASMLLTYLGNTADLNTITPKLTDFALTDEWRPNDKLYVSASVRLERDEYDLADTDTPAKNFWFAAAQKEFCVNPVTRDPMFVPQPPQSIFLFQPYVTFNCPIDVSTGTPIQTVHPNGTDGILLTNNYPSAYAQSYAEPRLSATYTLDNDTVLRISAGKYAQQPQNYEIQYNSVEPNLASELLGFIPFGFSSPLHEAEAQFSYNYDFSIEHHISGTDLAFKLTPYYRWATNQLYETVNLPSLGVSPSFNAGTERVDGVELEITKGDFDKNGLAMLLSYTYTNAAEKWGDFPDSTIGPIDQYNQDIEEYNVLATGSQCYANDFGLGYASTLPGVVSDPTCTPYSDPSTGLPYNPPIRNPYYGKQKQALLDPHGWYAPGLDFPYVSPNTFAFVLNYRHNRFAITPALSLQEGTTYGTPADVQGLDPRSCTQNQGGIGTPNGNPLNADYTSCGQALTNDGSLPGALYIPNPATGRFDTFGEFRQPWQFNLGMSVSYDITPRITGKVIVANLLNRCFGGSNEPWTRAYPPSSVFCGYIANTFYNGGNFFNGTSPSDVAANGVPENPYFAQPFVPSYGDPNSSNYPMALNIFASLQIKL
jgi:hypothetical protein